MTHTKESINALMQKSPKFLERCITKIYERQTKAEQSMEATLEHNGVGFNGCDAGFLSSLAMWIQKKSQKPEGERLTFGQQAGALRAMKKYAGQLARISNEIAEAKAQTSLGV